MIRTSTFATGILLCLAQIALPDPMHALDLPGAAVESGRTLEFASAEPFPSGPYQGENTPRLMAEGDVEQKAYRLTGTSLTSLQMITPVKTQLEDAGFNLLFSCADTFCGGFDFRYLLDLLPEPMMHVDLGDFQYLLARHPDGRVVSLLSSKAQETGFIQISTVTPSDDAMVGTDVTLTPAPTATVPSPLSGASDQGLTDRLAARGRVVLTDLSFETGSSSLGSGPFASLQNLAGYLSAHPGTTIVLVGHTDNTGALEANTALSRKRAEAVRERLISTYGIAPAQISAEGIGYLAPLTSNSSEEGRMQNRRVEAVIASTQ
ncbi:OmpA family protein [Celeribacter neptunius]|uniref:Outer membrane protein OmpA n=1 Tax=Celeribacter neptunius TaxID=588602 RepID=A0A1I3WZJ1_9RHOB|nr:OmpA family protein [Celeribacter neptunius]SFK11911.1 Outer membrane protein OmpA [Celeribacter neptunius]